MTAAEIEVAFRILFGRSFGQTGDVKLPEEDDAARRQHASLLFGEVLPDGVAKLLDASHLNAANATCLVDLGCGMAKLALQAFLTYRNLTSVVGVELCQSRFQEAKKRLSALASANPSILTWLPAANELTTADGGRSLKIVYGDMFAFDDICLADIVICETNVPADRHADLAQLVGRCKPGSRVLMYHTLRSMPGVSCVASDGRNQPPSLVINMRPPYYNDRQNYSGGHDRTMSLRPVAPFDPAATAYTGGTDRTATLRPIAPFDSAVLTSWSREKGHHFDLWLRLS
jgi:SAM-dependent methyltransferase